MLALLLAGCSAVGHASPRPTSSATPAPSVRATASPSPTPTPSSAPTPTRLKVVALGDSVTAGSHCDCTAFPELYGRGLAARDHVRITVDNAGVSGQTSADLLHALGTDAALDRSVSAADVVLVTIGANDYADHYTAVTGGRCASGGKPLACAKDELIQTGTTVTAILRRVQKLRAGQPTTVLVTGYWNVFEDGDVASAKFSASGLLATDRLTIAANTQIAAAATGTGARYVDLYGPFKGTRATRDPTPLLADDGDHPDAAGHRVIADALLAASPAH